MPTTLIIVAAVAILIILLATASYKVCPACQTRNHPNGRGYHCRNCGFTCNRDAVGAINILIRAKNGSYQPMDTNKTVHVKYLRATPIFQPEERREHGVIPGTGA